MILGLKQKTIELYGCMCRTCEEELFEVCSICQCDYNEDRLRTTLPCRHHFHQDCAQEWLSTYSKLCPVCKTSAVDED